MKKIAVIGYGYVGQAVYNFFKDHFEVTIYDPKYYNDEGTLKAGWQNEMMPTAGIPDSRKAALELANACDLAVVCVPTPEAENHSVDLGYVEGTIAWLKTPLILIKSTIPPGTTDYLKTSGKHICFSPEYIGEGKYEVQWYRHDWPHPTDMKKHSFQIIGGDKKDARAISEFFKKVVGPEVRYMVTDAKTAELCKYMENSWGATKVTFCNEFALVADQLGVDYDELRELFLLDGRVERMHTAVFKDMRGFGGKCFPKDVHGIVEHSKKAGYTPKLLEAVLSTNDEIRKLNTDEK